MAPAQKQFPDVKLQYLSEEEIMDIMDEAAAKRRREVERDCDG
jgi:hypothetical protein